MKRDELRTPSDLIGLVQEFRTIDLDPCASSKNIKNIPARRFYTSRVNDGLLNEWEGFVYLNPPYSKIEEWVTKLSLHPTGGIALLPVQLSQKWFQDMVLSKAHAVCFLRGRPIFKGLTRPVTFDVCIVLYGDMFYNLSLSDQIYRFTSIFSVAGSVLATPMHE